MKIDRVILSSNNNPLYYHFWKPLSKVYVEKFGIVPTLIWLGTEAELIELGLQDDYYGEIIIAKANDKYPIPFQTTWALFYHTLFYPNDVCLTIGIDQVPLSRMFFDMVKDFPDTDYSMLIADAYMPNHWTINGSASPTAYHIAKGSTFNDVYMFEDTFEQEIEKICNAGVKAFWEDTAGRWGLDETYSSMKLREYKGQINSLNNFGLLCERRIECERHKETPFDIDRLKAGWYSESHLCRPFTNHTEYITKMFNSISDYK